MKQSEWAAEMRKLSKFLDNYIALMSSGIMPNPDTPTTEHIMRIEKMRQAVLEGLRQYV